MFQHFAILLLYKKNVLEHNKVKHLDTEQKKTYQIDSRPVSYLPPTAPTTANPANQVRADIRQVPFYITGLVMAQ